MRDPRLPAVKICCIASVAGAVAAVGPCGLDLCSGIRTAGRLAAAGPRDFFVAVGGTGP